MILAGSKAIPKYCRAILLSILMLSVFELALQVRSQLRYGSSVFNVLSKETTYVTDGDTGLKLLRANSVIEGSEATIESNSIGLRSPEISIDKTTHVLRGAVVGASSVMGTYIRSNNDTLPYRLQEKLSDDYGADFFEIINAGMTGYSLKDQKRMIKRLLLPFGIDFLVIYPSFNDISGIYCGTLPKAKQEGYGLQDIGMPRWILSIDLISKNTVWLREVRANRKSIVDPATVDSKRYVTDLAELFRTASTANIPTLVLTNPRAYSREMPQDEQESLSENTRYYNPCFDTAGLHDLYDQHNDLIESVALQYGLKVYRLDTFMPHGSKYFLDATHPSIPGNQYAAGLISREIVDLLAAKIETTSAGSEIAP